MFEIFDQRAIKIIMLAQEESRRLYHTFVGTEHLLLALFKGNDILDKMFSAQRNVAASILTETGVKLVDCRLAVEKLKRRGGSPVTIVELPFTDNANLVLRSAKSLMQERGEKEITPCHLLIGLIDTDGTALKALKSLGVDTQALRETTIQALNFEKESRKR